MYEDFAPVYDGYLVGTTTLNHLADMGEIFAEYALLVNDASATISGEIVDNGNGKSCPSYIMTVTTCE
jgi:hypothetical protein